jgi:hypothetical protein
MPTEVRVDDTVGLQLEGGETLTAKVTAVTDQNTVDLEYYHHAAGRTTVTGAKRATVFRPDGVKAQGTLTMDTLPTDGDTYTIGGKTYTFQTTLTDVDGNVNIGGTLAQAKLNLVAAMDLSGVAGTDYATSMTAHPSVDAAAFSGNDCVLTAKVGGPSGNAIATTETFTAGTNVFDAATLGTTTAGIEEFWKMA